MSEESKPVGIDLGTTRSAVAQVTLDDVEVVFNSEGEAVTPSVVTIEEGGDAVVGQPALNQAVLNPDRTVREVKRKMGEDTEKVIGDESYTPEEISALILRKLINDAEEKVPSGIGESVITVPANFAENERSATENAGEIAGLDVERLLPEPSAACLAYGFHQGKLDEDVEEIVLVYDLGGGTFDASLVDVDFNRNIVETLNTEGENQVGGSDWTSAIAGWLTEEVKTAADDESIVDQPQVQAQIMDEARSLKHILSSKETAKVGSLIGGVAVDAELSREEFEDRTADLLEQTIDATDDLFERSDFGKDDVDKVLLVGGSTRMPQVAERVEDYFGFEPSVELNPDRAVAQGAAIQAELLSDQATGVTDTITGVDSGVVLVDVAPRSIGVKLHDGTTSHIIETDDEIPTVSRREDFRTVEDGQTVVEFPIMEGESEDASENDQIGKVRLEDIPPRPTNDESLAVEFELTADGTLQVEAEDLKTGEAVTASFESAVTLDEEEISKSQAELPSVSG